MIYTEPQFNTSHNRRSGIPSHWDCMCYGKCGSGANPIEALERATSKWLMFSRMEEVERQHADRINFITSK